LCRKAIYFWVASAQENRLTMRLLLVTGSYPPMRCGVGDYSHNLAKALAAVSCTRVGVLTSFAAGPDGDKEGISIFPLIKRWSLIELPAIVKAIRSWSPDIVHIQYPTQGYGDGFLPWLLPMVCFLLGKRVVQTWHEAYGRRVAPKLFLQAVIPGGLVLVRSNYRDDLPKVLHWAFWNKRVTFIRNASPFPKLELSNEDAGILKRRYLRARRRLIVFFGFVYPNKGAELLFEIADPASDQIVIAGEVVEGSDYHQKIMLLASEYPWSGKATVTGFLDPTAIAELLAVADAVILPYRSGGGDWNTSIHAAVLQGTFVITTSTARRGYDEKHNVFYAGINDVQEMKSALNAYAGRRRNPDPDIDRDEWTDIANQHRSLYEAVLHG
jgi:glycosyltransferase involved in cell wall biosynthesis